MDNSSSSAAVAAALASEVEAMQPGTRLPSHRELIARFGVSASTISAALARLNRRGLLETRPGAGTFRIATMPSRPVGDTSWQQATLELADGLARESGTGRTLQAPALLATLTTPGPDVIDLNGGYLHPELQPLAALGSALSRAARAPAAWQRPPAGGLPELRDWFAADLGGGLSRQDVLICGGGQAGLATALRALTQPGDSVLVESPTYPGTLAAARAAGLNPVPVPVDRDGLPLAPLEEALARTRARVIVLQPLFQNPTGVSLPRARLSAIREIARQHNAFVIEDDYARYLAHTETPLPAPMVLDDPDGSVIHLRSLTKATSPNLRVGALVARGPVMTRLRAAQVIDTMFVPAPLQQTALEIVTATSWKRVLARLQTALSQRRQTAIAAVDDVFGPDSLALRPEGGYHLWVRLPAEWDSRAFTDAALADSVVLTPGENYHALDNTASHVRISYVAAASTPEVDTGIRRLAGILARRD